MEVLIKTPKRFGTTFSPNRAVRTTRDHAGWLRRLAPGQTRVFELFSPHLCRGEPIFWLQSSICVQFTRILTAARIRLLGSTTEASTKQVIRRERESYSTAPGCWAAWALSPALGRSPTGIASFAGRVPNVSAICTWCSTITAFGCCLGALPQSGLPRTGLGVSPSCSRLVLPLWLRPVLLETFVQLPRFTGTAYRAANWRYVGLTKGRGKLENTIKTPYHRKQFSFIHCGPISKRSSHAESQRLHRIFTNVQKASPSTAARALSRLVLNVSADTIDARCAGLATDFWKFTTRASLPLPCSPSRCRMSPIATVSLLAGISDRFGKVDRFFPAKTDEQPLFRGTPTRAMLDCLCPA